MRRKIYKKLKSNGRPSIWFIEGAKYAYGARIEWSRSPRSATVTLDPDNALSPPVVLSVNGTTSKVHEVDLYSMKPDVIFIPDSTPKIILDSPAEGAVFVALDAEFHNEIPFDEPVPKGEVRVIREEDLGELPTSAEGITRMASKFTEDS